MSVFIVCFSSGFSERLPIFVLALSSDMSLAVYDSAQKHAIDLLHII